MPAGQRAYLSRLICAGGLAPEYRRVGSFGPRSNIPNDLTQDQQKALLDRLRGAIPPQPGEPDYHIVDGYELACGAEKRIIYMDMYHCGQPTPAEAPHGFSLRPE